MTDPRRYRITAESGRHSMIWAHGLLQLTEAAQAIAEEVQRGEWVDVEDVETGERVVRIRLEVVC